MPIYPLFASHSWSYCDAHARLIQMLRAHPEIDVRSLAVPNRAPNLDGPAADTLAFALEAKIRPCAVVLIMAGVYATYSAWINPEIEIAKRLGKPIIAVKPWGPQRISGPVRAAANEECPWNSVSIVRAITRWA
ncbi:TIR domain-containing protein [Pseudomonas typographi]|uniref:Molecular chaperone Tir n=1 Tax=Pseudomonas typographi TaxID=2715964 RepID=A0ABR7Z5V3_9PSED|nr:TIR domain-containing protein [Pseudomonas typographi]MBD1600794.1 molecular chaperone Tir [Pseudomonas typographi]